MTRVRKRPGGALGDAAPEDELHLIRPPHIQVLADHRLEEHATGEGAIEHLRERELCLQDGQLVAVARLAVLGGEGVGQQPQPLAQQGVEVRRAQSVAAGLRALRVVTGQQAVVQRRVADARLGQLALEVLVPVQTQLGGVRKVRAKLEEEGPKVGIDAGEVVLVDHCGRAHEPRVGLPGRRMAPLLGAKHRGLLLGLAHEEHALFPRKAGQVRGGHIVLALPLLEGDHRNRALLDEAPNRRHKRRTNRLPQRRRGEGLSAVEPEERHHPQLTLQLGDVHVEVQPVHTLQFQGDVLVQNRGHRACYPHRGLRVWRSSRPTDRLAVPHRAVLPDLTCFHHRRPFFPPHRRRSTTRRSEAEPR